MIAWRCFHCDEEFTDRAAAQEHFGYSQYSKPACKIDIAEYRRMERVHRAHCAEDTELHREIYRINAVHQTALRRAEETGYARGLEDAKKYPETRGLTRTPADETFNCVTKEQMNSNQIAVSVAEAARMTESHVRTIHYAIKRKELRAYRPGGRGDYRIFVDDLRVWVRGETVRT